MGEKGVKSEVNSRVRFREFHSEGNLFGSKSPANSLYFKIDANTAQWAEQWIVWWEWSNIQNIFSGMSFLLMCWAASGLSGDLWWYLDIMVTDANDTEYI